MIKAGKLLLSEDSTTTSRILPCFAHTLNLSIKSGLSNEAVKPLMKKVKGLTSHFHMSINDRETLQKISKAHLAAAPQSNASATYLKTFAETRWSSFYLVLDSLNQHKEALKEFSLRYNNRDVVALSISDWDTIEALHPIFNRLVSIIEGSQSRTNPTLSLVVPSLCGITTLMNDAFTTHNIVNPAVHNTTASGFIRSFYTDFQKRWYNVQVPTTIQVNTKYHQATLLDPRFKDIAISLWQPQAVSLLNEEIAYQKSLHPTEVLANKALDVTSGMQWLLMQNANSVTTNTELENYLAAPVLSNITTNIFEWWRLNRGSFPMLYHVARSILCIPASSASVERNFSKTRCIMNERNSTLGRNVGNDLCFLSLNREYLV